MNIENTAHLLAPVNGPVGVLSAMRRIVMRAAGEGVDHTLLSREAFKAKRLETVKCDFFHDTRTLLNRALLIDVTSGARNHRCHFGLWMHRAQAAKLESQSSGRGFGCGFQTNSGAAFADGICSGMR